MKLKNLLETPMIISPAMAQSPIAKKHRENMQFHFEKLIGEKAEWSKKVKHLLLKRVENNYILFNEEKGELYYGLQFLKFSDGITIKWMENYSSVSGLTNLVFTEILKYDDFVDAIYSGDSHTPENIELHKNLKKFTQLSVEVWDDKSKSITDENPYSGIYSNKKQFRFRLLEGIDPSHLEDETIRSIYLEEGFEPTKENLDHDLEYFICAYFFV
jgi:hypothetical protein